MGIYQQLRSPRYRLLEVPVLRKGKISDPAASFELPAKFNLQLQPNLSR